ncbi:hypothetical protein D3C81_1529580 [compost metagenome]
MRQDAAGVGLHGRQFRDQGAVLEFAGRHLDLGRQAQAAEFVGGTAIVVHRQQAGAGTVGAGVELEAEHAQGVQAETDRAWRVAGAQVEQEALGPLLALGLAGTVAEVAVEVVVLQCQVGLAVFDEALGTDGAGGQAGRQG